MNGLSTSKADVKKKGDESRLFLPRLGVYSSAFGAEKLSVRIEWSDVSEVQTRFADPIVQKGFAHSIRLGVMKHGALLHDA